MQPVYYQPFLYPSIAANSLHSAFTSFMGELRYSENNKQNVVENYR